MTPADLSLTVLHAVRRAVGDGALRGLDGQLPERVVIERPRPGGCGDWATNAALQLARPAAMPPRQVAEVLRDRLLDAPGVQRVDITGPGFLNLTLHPEARAQSSGGVVHAIRRHGVRYGYGDHLAHLGDITFTAPRHVRASVVTETVVALLRSQGARARVGDGSEAVHVLPVPYDVHAALGPDAARWALLRPAPHDRVQEPEALVRQTEDNPFFTVRYAHSRARALLRNAADLGFGPEGQDAPEVHDAHQVQADPDRTRLLAALADYPSALTAAARLRAPDRLARHLEVVADALLGFQHTVLPRGDEKPSAAHRSRLALAEAAGTVLAGGLSLLGISAPDHL
ncbi:ArgS-related anticodon-binding protein NrtL [Streptomyces coeruleoprunus]|uniref:arginine--tRNA ligase n=1 Tax=Streptomyces coeruleoprunus TaxID=285563 RepID=A0ABV9XKA3_9ACTN